MTIMTSPSQQEWQKQKQKGYRKRKNDSAGDADIPSKKPFNGDIIRRIVSEYKEQTE